MRIPMKPCYIISHLAADVSTGEYVALTLYRFVYYTNLK